MSKDCVSPPEIDEKQLLMYLDGEADEQTVLHLQRCSHCRAKAEALDLFQRRLTERVYRATCPPSIELGEYHLRMLPASQMLVIAQHVRECPHCRREMAELETFFLDDMAPEMGFLGTAKVLIARLTGLQTESGKQAKNDLAQVVPMLRGETKGPLTFEAEGMVISLDVQQAPNGQVSLLGQVAADDQDRWTAAEVDLQQDDSSQRSAALDDLGGFRFENIGPGVIQITIKSLHGIHVQVPNIDIAI